MSSEVDGQGKQPKARKPYTITKARERWTENEHARFLEGLTLFGRSWGKVAQHVQTKTTIQIRSHAQKYFNRVKKQQECQQSNATTWQTVGSDKSNGFLQSWQAAAGDAPAADTSISGASEPFQRAAEIVAAAATEAAAAAASVVVSAASKKIKEQLESLYSSQASAPGSCGNLAAQPQQMQRQGAQAATAALTEGAKAPTELALNYDNTPGSSSAQKAAGDGAEGVQQSSLMNNMQSIESAIVFKAMQRISSLFQQEQVPNGGGVDVVMANAVQHKTAVQTGWLPGSGGSSAFVPLAKDAGQGTSEGGDRDAANAPEALNQPTDGAFCADSDVVGDVQKEVNSGEGASQAFSEVGMDDNSKRTAPTPPTAAAKPGSPENDSGSSHVSEPPQKRIALQKDRGTVPPPATSGSPPACATSHPPAAHIAQAGRYSIAKQHLNLAQSMHHNRHDSRIGVSPEGAMMSFGQTLQSLNPTGVATQTFEGFAPTSVGHASVNKPTSNGNGASIENTNRNGQGTINAKGVSNELHSNGTGHNSNSSVANGSNASVMTCTGANSSVPGFRQVPSSTLPGNSLGTVPTTSTFPPEPPSSSDEAARAALMLSAIAQPPAEPRKAKEHTKGQSMSKTVQPPATAFTPVHPQLPSWTLTESGGPPAPAALQQPFAVQPVPQAVMQAGFLGVGDQLAQPMPLQVAGCGVQSPPSSLSLPTDSTSMGWWPPGMSMQNLVNLMVGSQMAQFKQTAEDASGGQQPAHESIDNTKPAGKVHADGS